MSDGSRHQPTGRLVLGDRHGHVTRRTRGLRLPSRETYATEVARQYRWGVNNNTHVVRSNGRNHFVRSRSTTSRTHEGRSSGHQPRERSRPRADALNDHGREHDRSRQSRNYSDQPNGQTGRRDRVETWLRDTHRHIVLEDRYGDARRGDQRHPLDRPRGSSNRGSERPDRGGPSYPCAPPRYRPESRPSSYRTAHEDFTFVTPPRPGTVRTMSSTETVIPVGDQFPHWYSDWSDE